MLNIYFVLVSKNSNTYNISVQFKMSIESLLDRPKELLELIGDCLKPKIIEKKTFGEVFTPMNFINDSMLKDIEDYCMDKYNENIWTNEKITWYDPAAGMGNYPIAIYYKLMEGLKSKIPDEKERKKHIIEKQLYMGELNKKNCFVVRQIFNINNEYKLNLYEGDTLKIDIKKIFNIKKFAIIIGNPPYNEELQTKKGSAPALYHKFIEYYIDKCNILSFIIPSRWFAGGKGLDNFREMMLNRIDIVYIKHYDNACDIFGKLVEIKGGVNYFLIDKNYEGLCEYNGSKIKLNKYDICVDGKYYNIIDKIIKYKSISNIYIGQTYSGINTNDNRLIDKKTNTTLLCFVSQQKGFIKYIEPAMITKTRNFNKWKVITVEASFGANSSFGNMFVGKPNEICNQSYVLFEVNSEEEANSLLSYLKCKLPNLMLSMRKASQHISASTCEWIPLPPLNKIWNDDEVYKYFKLSENEIKLIKETNIIGYKDLVQVQVQNIGEANKKLISNQFVSLCDKFHYGINMETSINKKTNTKPTFKIPYYTPEDIIYCDTFTYNGRFIICDTINIPKYHIKNGKFNASKEMILIELKEEYTIYFRQIYEYIKNNFKYDINNKKSIMSQLQHFEIILTN